MRDHFPDTEPAQFKQDKRPAALHKEGAGGEPILTRVKLYLDSWAAYPAKELGEQPTAYVHGLLRELYEAIASPAGRAEQER